MKKNNSLVIYIAIVVFGGLGIYFMFFSGDTSKYDGKTEAYKIDPNERYDSESGTTYHPIYYFKVAGKEYECSSMGGSSKYPNENKNIVYYDTSNPEKCKTEYEKTTSRGAGIILLIVTAIIIYFFLIKEPTNAPPKMIGENQLNEAYQEPTPEQQEMAIETINKIMLVVKRIILGFAIFILLFLVAFDTLLYKQTIDSKDYIETTAEFKEKKEESESEIFDDYIYEFTDKEGKQQEIIKSISKGENAEYEIKIKYDEKNPQEYVEDSNILDKKEMIWYYVKIGITVLLIIIFFNKKLLNKIKILSIQIKKS